MTTPARILIVKPSSLGDVVHALPTVDRLRAKFSDAHIAWLINDNLAPLLQRCPLVNDLIPFHRQQPGRFFALLRQLRSGKFDLVIDLQGLLRSGIFACATAAPCRIGLSDSREGAHLFHNEIVSVPRCHAVDRYLKAADHLGCPPLPIEFPLGLPHEAPSGPKLIAVNPSARWPTKLWGETKFAELIRRLPPERVVLTGSVNEAPMVERIAQGRQSLAGKTNLLELAELYRKCAVVITNDTGPMHIAAAVRTPVVAIFGPTDPALTAPYGRQHIILRAGIACSPCFRNRCHHTPTMECMDKVTVSQVLESVQRFLA